MIMLATLSVGVAVLAVVLSTHAAWAAGSGSNSTTPIGSGPQAPALAPLYPKSDETRSVVTLLKLVGIESLIIFAAICAGMIINITRFSHHPGQQDDPKQVYGSRRIEYAWTIIPAVILLFGFIATVVVLVQINDPSKAEASSALQVNVTGHQWWWQFDIPSEGVHTANALQLPDNRWVEFNITSVDVLHSFWIPQLVVQVYAIPNQTTHLFLHGQSDGLYPAACYQFCGQGHAWMQFQVRVEKPAQFQTWVEHERKPLPKHLTLLEQEGEAQFVAHSCSACHTIDGVPGANGTFAPNLTHVGSRWAIAGGVLPMSVANLERWIRDPDTWKQGAKMPGFTDMTSAQLHALAVFLHDGAK
jgi:cytochrome c oxidase subunit 2